MNYFKKLESKKVKRLILSLGTVSLIAGCNSQALETNQPIKIDGSSTVFPITKAVVEKFKTTQEKPVEITTEVSGTTGGFRKFCEGQTDISNASRPINKEEIAACDKSKVRYVELPVAFDALTVTVNNQNTWAESLTTIELKKLWEPAAEGQIRRWNQIRSSFPDKPINLFGPDKDSGTFDYFTEAIVGTAGQSRTDYVKSEDDNVLAQGVSQDANALGYFGQAYYEKRNKDMKAVAIDSGTGPILPSRETVAEAKYHPLARPLFIYVNLEKAQKNPALSAFVQFYVENAEKIVGEVGYVPLTPEHYHLAKVSFHNGEVGTVFDGQLPLNLTLGELLRKKAVF